MISIRRGCVYWVSIGILLFAAPCLSFAARLKDIRIGEYEKFTRIVFESDIEPVDAQIRALPSGQLTLVFKETQPAFIRKIPIDRGHFIQDLQVLVQKGQLAIVLDFNRPYERWKTFELDSPPRFALDIFWQAGASIPEPARDLQPHPEPQSIGDGQANPAPGFTEPPFDSTIPGIDSETAPPPASTENLHSDVLDNETIITAQDRNASAPPENEITHESTDRAPANGQSATPSDAEKGIDKSRPSGVGRFQYFLILALVVITVGILFILIWMLVSNQISRRKATPPKIDESLKHQDERIASINARVREQLKRYDEV
ncbi:hypothetical protein [Desulfatitalea tepidiphila]|uniref:hypothetical protein n=1 Tax=Desulfatitalea tepidiphila TaxID=1185843 RepID=UPI00128F99F2|nr:hypothetical protein [Desulfatitalea tepidiphila]